MLRSCDRKNIEKIRDYLNSNNFKQRVRNHGVEPLIRYHEYNNEFRAPTIYIDLSNNDGNIIKDLALKIYDKFKEKFGNEFEVLFDDRYQFTTFTSSLIIPFNRKNLNIIQGNIENAFPLSAPIEKNVDAKKMFEKISKKYPEIKGILSNNPKWENRANVSDATIDRHAESYKQMLEDIKSEPISNFEITPQQKQQATFMFSEFLDVYLQDFEQVERILKEEKIIEKDCTSGGKLKAEKGFVTNNFTKNSKWKLIEEFDGKSHTQGGIDIKLTDKGFTFKNGNAPEIKAKFGLLIPNKK